MRRFSALFSAALLSISALGSICAATTAAAERPNVLFLLSDDQRPDALGASGNTYVRTPHLDRLARQGVTVTRAVCAYPICTPSRAEIISGASSFRNGVLDFGGRFRDDLAYWPETMRRAGYHTWYVGKWHVRGRPADFGIEECNGLYSGGGGKWWKDQTDWKGEPITGYRGWVFQTADGKTKFPDRGVGLTPNISGLFADAAIELIKRKTDRPFFLQVSFTAPHDPLIMPPDYEDAYDKAALPLWPNFLSRHPFDHGNFDGRDEKLLPWPRTPEMVRDVTAMYYRVVSHMDEQIGRILQALKDSGRADNTIIIFSSDHGLGVGSHGLRGKQSMYEHTIGVPLIIRGPGVKSNHRADAQVYLRELFPTVCDLCSIPIPKQVESKGFARVLSGREDTHHKYVFGYFRDKQRMIRGERWKLIDYPEAKVRQLFDLHNDPHEVRNLAGVKEHAAVEKDLSHRLAAWRKSVGDE
ncbi:MAG: sulfatase-like hydrolase/transferase [Pirellulaceae bacterium]|jgi:arylsulfatase A-like enzyme|nr:sulfatase-like hydrolase/transferase [Pirellulaceae bacterium]MDP7014670.1 sulfatase-like hydrolase/transferase [Pirellulaceae bacterium]